MNGIQASQDRRSADADDGEPLRAAACMKHFLGYSHPTSGHDRSPNRIPEQELLDLYLRPFQVYSLFVFLFCVVCWMLGWVGEWREGRVDTGYIKAFDG